MGVGLRPIEKSVDLPPNPKVARAAFLSKLRGVRGNSHSYRDQKPRIPQVQGIKAAAVVVYRKVLITQEMRCHRLVRLWRAFLEGKQHSKKGVFIGCHQRLDLMMVTPINAKPLSKPFNV